MADVKAVDLRRQTDGHGYHVGCECDLIDRIATLEAENVRLKAWVEQLQEDKDHLLAVCTVYREKVERLSAPVSDDELFEAGGCNWNKIVNEVVRELVGKIIAARAVKEQK